VSSAPVNLPVGADYAALLRYIELAQPRKVVLNHGWRDFVWRLRRLGVDATYLEANEQLGFKPDLRNYGIGAQILLDLQLKKIRPLTNNPRKLIGLEGYGLRIIDRVPIQTAPTAFNSGYIETKRAKLGHLFSVETAR